jgi:hypothetical protein
MSPQFGSSEHPRGVGRPSRLLVALAVALAFLPACGTGGANSSPRYCARVSDQPLPGVDADLVKSVRAVERFGLRPGYLAPASLSPAVGSLIPGPRAGLTGLATNACSMQTARTGVVVLLSFRTPKIATAWVNGSASPWHDAVDVAAIPQNPGDQPRGIVLGSSCKIVGVYENLVSPVAVAAKVHTVPHASQQDLLSDPSVGMRVLPPQFGC